YPRPMDVPVQTSSTGHGSMLLSLADAPNLPARIGRTGVRVAGHEQRVSFVADVMEPAGQIRIDDCAAGVDRRSAPVRVTDFVAAVRRRRRIFFDIDEESAVIRPGYPGDETVPHLGEIDAGSRPLEHNGRPETLAVRVGSAVAHHRGPFRCALAEPLADRAQARAAGSIDDLGAITPVDDEHARLEHDCSGMFAFPDLRRIPDDVLALGQVEQLHIFELSFGSSSAG